MRDFDEPLAAPLIQKALPSPLSIIEQLIYNIIEVLLPSNIQAFVMYKEIPDVLLMSFTEAMAYPN